MNQNPELLHHQLFDSGRLWRDFPPRLGHRNKQLVFNLAYPDESLPAGQISVTHWKGFFAGDNDGTTACHVLPNFYDYEPVVADAIEWHVNFADSDLFGFYSGSLFAQDELQVCEHPVLASVREALASNALAFTVRNGQGIPVLIRGVERRCRFDLTERPDLGLPYGLYGNAFSTATKTALEDLTHILNPPGQSNIIAMAAPRYGEGQYSRNEIEYVLNTAYTGFRGAVLESRKAGAPTSIHTGWWGCGAFGGNRTMMAMLQYVAATRAEVETFVFHSGNNELASEAADALEDARQLVSEITDTDTLLSTIEDLKLEWGISNGT